MSQKTIASYFKKQTTANGSENKARKSGGGNENDEKSSLKRDLVLEEKNHQLKRSKNEKESQEELQNSECAPASSPYEDVPTDDCNEMEVDDADIKKTDFKKVFSLQKGNKDIEGIDYNPAKSNYHPIDDAFWKKSQRTPYMALARTFQLIEEISGRLKMIEVLSNFFRSVLVLNAADILPCVYLSLNLLAPSYEGLELGIAESSLIRAICKATGQSLAHIRSQLANIGDLGIVAEQARSSQRLMYQPSPLTIVGVYEALKEIAKLSGHSAVQKKMEKIQTILVACRLCEARYFTRSLLGKLRIGIAEQNLMQALGMAITNTPPNQGDSYPPKILCAAKAVDAGKFKSAVEENTHFLRTVYCQFPNYDRIIPLMLKHAASELPALCPMEPGVPVRPMLAHPTTGIHEVLSRFGEVEFTCEWKYDGERAQIHHGTDGGVSIYSRNQENHTLKYPDIIARIGAMKRSDVSSFILDSEVVAWDNANKRILPFQVLSGRKRKNVEQSDITIDVCVFMFDLLYLNGESLTSKSLKERRQLLRDHFNEVAEQWCFATAIDTSDTDEVQQFLEDSIKGSCEGLMIKTLHKDAAYEISKRSRNWLKLKKDYLAGVGDSLDLVVIGGYNGKGKRTGLYGGFLLACYDPDTEEYQCICKIGTGFSDDDLKVHSAFFKDHVITQAKSYYKYDASLEADVWFEPVQLWEVKCADLSLSPIHMAAIGAIEPEKGISLRFPRFIRIRADKSPEEATAAQQVVDMYLAQSQIRAQNGASNKADFERDFY